MATLSTDALCELAVELSNKLTECGYYGEAELSLKMNKEMLRKIDEDIFYREFKHGTDEKMPPSDGTVEMKCGDILIRMYSD